MNTTDPLPSVPDPAAAAAWHAAADELAGWALARLVNRTDRYGAYGPNGPFTAPGAKAGGARPGVVDHQLLRRHFSARGRGDVIGVHGLTPAGDGAPSAGKWVGIDFDNHDDTPELDALNLRQAVGLYRRLAALGFHPLLCTWGGGSFHLRVLFDRPVSGEVLHPFGKWLVADWRAAGLPQEPESFPKRAAVPAGKYDNWLRLPGRHHKRDVWAVVFDGGRWVQGAAAVEQLVARAGDSSDLIPAAAIPAPDPPPAPPAARPAAANGRGGVPAPRGGRADVFAEYNRHVTFDEVVGWHKERGHTPTREEPGRVEFRRAGKRDGGESFNVKLCRGVPITYNFSTSADLPPNAGLSPSQVRCLYARGRCDTRTMNDFAAELARELGYPEPAANGRGHAGRPSANGQAAAGQAPPVEVGELTESGYAVIDGCTYKCVLTWDKERGREVVTERKKLANFAARIVADTCTDDGAETSRSFAVEVTRPGRPVVTVDVPAERFAGLGWVLDRCGPGYVIQPGNGKLGQLAAAIQERSGDPPAATVYTHTGWREVGGRWCYLHAGGAIGADGVEVRLDGAAARFHLPPPPTGDELRAAVRASLGILDGLAPAVVAFPLLATVYRAPLGGADYALWLAGLTGVHKSELAALAQQHFGLGMSRTRLPGSWSSTDNALEGLAYAVKDALLVVDDFAPSSSRPDADRQHRAAERLIRGTGNAAGRQRMRADGTLRPPKPPRALVVGTGEDVPRGHSITARLCVTAVGRGAVDLARLSACQRDAAAGLYAAAMAGYLAWLAPQLPAARDRLDLERVELRDRFVGRFAHARTPDTVANLLVGFRWLLRFAEDVGAVTGREAADVWGCAEAAFLDVAREQAEHQRAADPVARFPEMLAAVLTGGRGHVAGEDGRPPSPLTPEAWGWDGRDMRPRGDLLGWAVGDTLCLIPDVTYAAVVELAKDQGQGFPLSPSQLFRRLKEARILTRTQTDRTTYPITLAGIRRDLLHVAVTTVFPKPAPAAGGDGDA